MIKIILDRLNLASQEKKKNSYSFFPSITAVADKIKKKKKRLHCEKVQLKRGDA